MSSLYSSVDSNSRLASTAAASVADLALIPAPAPVSSSSSTTTATSTTNPSAQKPVAGLPALNLNKTLVSQREQLEIYRQLLETLAASEQETTVLFPVLSKSLVTHIGTVNKLKDDLQDVFTRIRALKAHFRGEYPEVFDYVQSLHVDELDDEEGDMY
ncbi:hypothetical protein BX661DRAFT_187638 [Kickxella alabastrina]|uniref:uncharacterized protein n=1 Tax=Kickxella alabastrina TaxID=61397 RepID=UPI002220EA70|nr:uncharacterized protein BX661DRAFT_187638 [Kickxella alabastrina]KAI7822292.1 hypothetical protein BX661DRAFT_187638 [Kickxella alabastrina]KAJ1946647.1 hypothetical protein GGF37_001039 [Kickxella alabastrina]